MPTPTEESLAALATVEGDGPPLENISLNTAHVEISDGVAAAAFAGIITEANLDADNLP